MQMIRRLTVVLLIVTAGCTTTDRTRRAYLEALALQNQPPEVPVVVIPGFGVSRLRDPATTRFVWGTPRSVARIDVPEGLELPLDRETLRFGRDSLVPDGFAGSRGPINTAWQLTEALVRFGGYQRDSVGMAGTVEGAPVYALAWDWRQSLSLATRELDRQIESIRRDHDDPALRVDLIGHSAGALVALLYLRIGTASLDEPEQWDGAAAAARAKVRRLVAIAAPQRGVTDPLRVVVQPERFFRRIFFPEMVATWPSLAELISFDGRFVIDEEGNLLDADLHDIDGWRALEVGLFDTAVRERVIELEGDEALAQLERGFEQSLQSARRFREAMEQPLDGSVPVALMAGDCVETPRHALRRADGSYAFYRRQLRPDEQQLGQLLLEPGDGTVPLSSATAGNGEAATLFCNGHQGLAADPQLHRAILRFLQD
jgi:pimeloyl-ACP methyl ester carboxylesterase